jgi:energy-coupling factor transport system permease protein
MVTMTTPLEHLVMGLIELGVPYEIAFAATTALNFVPVLQSDARKIIDAQKARAFTALERGGLLTRLRAYIPILIPLMIGALRKGQQLEIAMESRAFGAFEERTYLIEIKMEARDYIFTIFTVLATVSCFFLRIWKGFGTFGM